MANSLFISLLLAATTVQDGGAPLDDEQLEPLAESLAAYFEARAQALGLDEARGDLEARLADTGELLGDAHPLSAPLTLGRAAWLARGATFEGRPGRLVEGLYEEGSFAAAGLEFAYRTPKQLPQDGAGWPLILSLPDHGEEPAEHIREQWTSPAVRDGAIVFCPAMPTERDDWTQVMVRGRPGGLSHVVTALRLAAERFPIDFDRVVVVGHGRSVPAAVAAGNSSPQCFAGIVGRAGDVGDVGTVGTGTGQLPDNFGNLPTFFTGAGPEATRFQSAARADDRAACTLQQDGDEADVWSWIQAHPREPFPEAVHLTVGQPFPTRIGWLRVSPSAPDAEVTATLDRAANSVALVGHGVSHATLYLNDELLDLARPVLIVSNGVERTLNVTRVLATTLNLLQDGTSDPGCVYVAQVVCNMSGEPRAAVVGSGRAADPEFDARLAAAGAGDGSASLMELRDWCLASGREARAAELLRQVLRQYPADVAAREAAGQVLEGERWFASVAHRDRFSASQDPAAAEAKGHVRHKRLWMHPAEKARASKGWVRDPDTGLWETPDDRRRLARGWVRQDLEWIAPEQATHVDAGLWLVDGEWLDLARADERHARLDSMWRIPSPDVLLHSTASRAACEAALAHMALAVADLRRVFGVEPELPLPVALLASEEQIDRFAFGEPDGRRYATHAGRTHVIQGAFFAERWYERVGGKLEFRGMGVGFWDALIPYGDSFGVHSARLALGLSFVDAIDPSPKAVRGALSKGIDPDYDADWRAEKRLPGWLRWGAAVYAERFFRDAAVAEGGDAWWARTWSLGSLASRGGPRALEQILAFELDPDDREDAQKLLIEAGLVVAFMLDGDNARVGEAHAELKRALVSGRLHSKYLAALEQALLAEASAFQAFAE